MPHVYITNVIGEKGDDGKSAYELAVESGYVGTLEEWLESLRGETGEGGKNAYEIAVEKRAFYRIRRGMA